MNEFTKNKVLEIVAEVLDLSIDEINIDKHRKEYEEWDSLAHVQIIAGIIDEFNISLSLEDAAEVTNLRELIKLIGG